MEIIHDSSWFATTIMKLKWNRRMKHLIDTQPKASIDKKSGAPIGDELEAPIDSDHANEIHDFPEGSINS